MQHLLASELEGLEEVRFPRPRHELGSTISCQFEGYRGPESSSVLTPSGTQRNESRGCSDSPRCQPRMFRKAGRHHVCPHRHTGPCPIPLSAASRLAFGGWRAHHPNWRPGLISSPSPEAPIPAPSTPAEARLGPGSGGQCLPWLAARLLLFAPACAPTPRQRSHSPRPTLLA